MATVDLGSVIGPQGPKGTSGDRGYSITGAVTENNIDKATWDRWCSPTETVEGFPKAPAGRIGDFLIVTGTAYDTKDSYTLIFKYTQAKSDSSTFKGTCQAYFISARGEQGPKGDTPSWSSIVDLIYPVGSVYECKTDVKDVNPANAFGGTWTLDTTTYQFAGIKRYWRTK